MSTSSSSPPPGWCLHAAPDQPAGGPPPGSWWATDHADTGASTTIQASRESAVAAAWALRERLQAMLDRRRQAA